MDSYSRPPERCQSNQWMEPGSRASLGAMWEEHVARTVLR